jgi:hypothetical protein
MSINYKKYEPGFEEHQAFVYNDAVKKYKGETVTKKEIKERLESHSPKQDLEGINFAFTGEGKPLAYIQYRIYQGNRLFIGFPWATENCPQNVQETLFNNLTTYLKNKYPAQNQIFLGYISDDYIDVHKQIEKFGFEKDEWFGYYTLNPKNTENISLDGFTYTKAEEKDIDSILSIAKLDSSINYDGDEERWRKYFTDRFDDTSILLLFKENTIIASVGITTATLTKEEIQTRFIVFNPAYEKHFEQLLGAIGQYSKEKNVTGTYQIILGTGEESRIPILEKLGGKKSSLSSQYRKDL